MPWCRRRDEGLVVYAVCAAYAACMFLGFLIKWFFVYLRMFAEIMGWKRLATWIGKFVKDEPDLKFEKPVV